jgi:hypothetical protein
MSPSIGSVLGVGFAARLAAVCFLARRFVQATQARLDMYLSRPPHFLQRLSPSLVTGGSITARSI